MKVKIEIKHFITGSILFEYESENNTIKQTVIEAVKNKVDLQGVDLRGADLQGIDLRGVDLQAANLWAANLWGADLRGVKIWGSSLQGADLRGADLRGADLQGVKIKKAIVFTGLYDYLVVPYITETDECRIKMGCYDRSLSEWNENFWNNNKEFPNNGSIKSNLRLMAFETAKKWFEIINATIKP